MILPSYPPQVWLKSFWLAWSLISGLTVGACVALEIGALVGLTAGVVGLKRPEIASFPYRVWNKLSRKFARMARLCLNGICFYVIFFVLRLSGSRVLLARPERHESLWVPRGAGGVYTHGISPDCQKHRWIANFFSWAKQSGNGWACCLLPFLILISVLEADEQNEVVPANTYTLF